MSKHRWSEPSRETELETTRTCLTCGMLRVTHHEGAGFPWTEWLDQDGAKIYAIRTPECPFERQPQVNSPSSPR